MSSLHYIIGDATLPIKTPAIIAHVCNDVNKFGKGFVVALSQRYPSTKIQYHDWFKTGNPNLGEVQFVQVKPYIYVANMISQHGVRSNSMINQHGVHCKMGHESPSLRYSALSECLSIVFKKAADENLTVHMPRIGAELAGGDWNSIEKIVKNTMSTETYVYTLKEQRNKWPTNYEN